MATPIRPVIAPEPFTGEGSWDDWIDHFESVAAINKWEDGQKLLWIRVRMTGRAQRTYKNLSEEAKGRYGLCKKGLRERFKPASKKELYQAEFHVRRKRRTEEWAAFAEDLKILADRAFPDLQEEAKEHLALTHYLGQLENPQVAIDVKHRRPKTVDEAVTVTLELESYLLPKTGRIGQVGLEAPDMEAAVAAAVRTKNDPLMEMMQAMMERLERLESEKKSDPRQGRPSRKGPAQRGPQSGTWAEARKTGERTDRQPRPIICYKCNQEGHIARGCRALMYQQSGN